MMDAERKGFMGIRFMVADGHYFFRVGEVMKCRRCAYVLRDVDEVVTQKCLK